MADEDYLVGNGESIISIAKNKGHFWEKLWNHNAELKSLRKNPNVLYRGDIVKVPEIVPADFAKGSDQRHKFKRKGEPVKIKLRLAMMDEPRANEAYTFLVEGEERKGTTNADGELEEFIPGNACSGTLILKDGMEQYPINIGVLDPIEVPTGIIQRLNNLGYDCGDETDAIGEKTQEALKKFQTKHNLTVTGEPDAATKAKLLELHQ